ncbi:MAG: ATP-binding protein [Candidatus Hydrothermarchaeales archaeon]
MTEASLLIVDDAEGIRETLSDIFKEKGYGTDVAEDGRAAIEKVKKSFFNVVLLDIRLPDILGVEVLESLKEIRPDIEVIMITAYASLETSIEALNKGAYAYIMKPLNMGVVIATVKKALEKQRLSAENMWLTEFNERIIKNAPIGILTTDEKGDITSANPAILEILDSLETEKLIGLSVLTLPTSRAMGLDKELKKVLSEGKEIELAGKYVSESGADVFLHIRSTPLRNEKRDITGLLAIIEDVTERKKLDSMKDAFISNVSHELRTPLTSILTSLELLSKETVEKEKRKLLEICDRNALRLNRLVDNLLEVSRIEVETLDVRTLDVTRVVAEIISELQDFAVVSKVTLKSLIEDEFLVRADKKSLRLVFLNLISNAIKFNKEGGKVTISGEREDSFTRFCVEDTGIGIPRGDLKEIFKSFYQIDASIRRRYPGAGVGLTITKNIVDAHGGKIWAESKPGKGSKFCFTLPSGSRTGKKIKEVG